MQTEIPLNDALAEVTLQQLETDPYPLYERMRAEAPVAHVPLLGTWVATGYREVKEINQNAKHFAASLADPVSECLGKGSIIDLDGPRHQRYRRGLHSCLAPRMVEAYADTKIVPVVQRQLATLSDGPAELMTDYFEPISVLSLGAIIGVPEVDADTLRHWFRGIVLGTSNNTNVRAVAVEANAISGEIDDYMRGVFERLEAEPDDSIVSHLLRHAEGATLEERVVDVSPTLKVVIGGGLQEPGHGASTLTLALLSDDAQLDRFRSDPAEMIGPAMEEALRWVAPIQIISKKTNVDVELGGEQIPAGTYVIASLASANREASVYGEDADRFNIDRPREQHLGFGFGTHFCSGSYFGRVVMRESVRALFDRFPDMTLDSDRVSQFRGFAFRAPAAVHVELA